MTVDSHMHIGDFPMFDVGMDQPGLAELFAEFDYDAGIVFHPDNDLTRKVVEQTPKAFAMYWANPRLPGCAEEAASYLDEERFVGIKMHPLLDSYHPNDPIVHPIARLAIERDVPILIHSGHPIFTLPWSIEELIREFPDAKIILGHMGHGNIVYINAAIDIAVRNPNVWLETSGMPMHTKIKTAVDRAGDDRVLYGSDAPFHDPGAEMRKVEVSGCDEREVSRVLDLNARRLFFGSDDVDLAAWSGSGRAA